MKINAKLFLLVFTIITLVSVTSAFIYHTLAQQLLHKQQSKVIINSANDFIFAFEQLVQNIDEEYQKSIIEKNSDISDSKIDFIFETLGDSTIITNSFRTRQGVKIYKDVKNINELFHFNSNIILRHNSKSSKNTYYGILIDSEILKSLSEKIRAEIAFVEGNVVTKFTKVDEYNFYLPYLSKAARELKTKNNFEIIHENIEDVDFTATHYTPKVPDVNKRELDFIIFNISREATAFKNTMSIVTFIIVIAGILLSIIFLFLFTTKFRKQLEFISEGVTKITYGKTRERVKIISNDEIGSLGIAFNNMLDELDKKDLAEKEYAEFISLINQNPSLEGIGDATLQKIINTTGVDVGAFYIHENNEFLPFAVFGIPNKKQNLIIESGIYNKAKEQKEIIELSFTENHPVVKTGLTEFRISHIYIQPIFYNNEIIAILELASVKEPKIIVKDYLDKIKAQLAIGLANGKALTELKKLVDELKNLNKAYQEQNFEISTKNEELLKLHDKLKKGSKELEIQTLKAVESEKIKSQFLANMSHELRTPQNSILGLTELILKDEKTSPKTRERLNVVLRNGKKLLTLIENILEYSKLEAGNSEIKKSNILLSELIDEVYSFIHPLFLESDVDFNIKIPKDYDYELYTDVKKIEQIIYNLIGNAIKFTINGFVKLQININENDVEIIVEDTGPGISEDDRKIIFEEFRQVDANLNRKFSGSGLGLAICKTVNRYERIWQTGSWQRSISNFRFGSEIVRNGRIGKVHTVEVSLPHGHSDFGGTAGQETPMEPPISLDYNTWLGPAPYAPYAPARVHKNWRWNLDYGGGQLLDWIGHHCDIAHWGMDFDNTGPYEVEGNGFYPETGLWNTATKYYVTAKYKNDVKLIIAGGYPEICNGKHGTKWIGEEGWVHVDRGFIDAHPKSLLSNNFGPNDLRLYKSPGHSKNFLDCVKSRNKTLTPVEVAHRSATPGHLGQISMLLKRKINFDPVNQKIIGDEVASSMLGRSYRSPWHI